MEFHRDLTVESVLAFLGNHFFQVPGNNFACLSISISNPYQSSECTLLSQLAPSLSEDLIRHLLAAFQDLRKGYEEEKLGYPYLLRGG